MLDVGRDLLDLRDDVAHDIARADEAFDADLGVELFPQIGVVDLEPIAQLLDLVERPPELLLRLLPRRDVAVRAAGAKVLAVLADDRRTDVFDPPHLAASRPDPELG